MSKIVAKPTEGAPQGSVPGPGLGIGEVDLHLFNEGTHDRLYEKLGAHPGVYDGVEGTRFAVWAPNAGNVSVVGDFNRWTPGKTALSPLGSSGIWAGVVPGVGEGACYKYHLAGAGHGHRADKADPFGFQHEHPPRTGSIVRRLDYTWGDEAWMRERRARNALDAPMAVYELHLGSWQRHADGRVLGYREVAQPLADHVERLGFTHVQLMPIMEHPFDGSWGYQVTGYFAPTSRYGSPQDFMYLVDFLHQRGIGVLLDWPPAHFPTDGHGLGFFDGTHLFEHADPRRGFHPDWQSLIFNYGRHEVRGFLVASALFWFDRYHIDGLRVDAVASMLYRDYSRAEGEWVPNEYGGRENLEAIDFLRQLNTTVYARHPDVQMIAEESTAWPGVSRPCHLGGLGFGLKWDMGWMHDTLSYLARDPVHRKFHHHELTFRAIYAFHENFVLPLSHDEVVHGKQSLLSKMPGDYWQKFANLRLLYALMYGQPGKKLLFMGAELGQWHEWRHGEALDWALAGFPAHEGLARLLGDLNRLYRSVPALHARDADARGFEWIEANDDEQSVLVFARHGATADQRVVVALNFTPVPRHGYRVGVEQGGRWRELLNSDAEAYGGSGVGNLGGVDADAWPWDGRPCSLALTLPPLGAVFLAPDR